MPLDILLISTYEMGRQPFGLASPAAWLAARGFRVVQNDVALDNLNVGATRAARLVAFHLPMHTATRLAARLIPRVRSLNPDAHVACFGLYAPMNAEYLRGLGAGTILGGEFEAGLAALAERLAGVGAGAAEPGAPAPQRLAEISLARQRFLTPDRAGLPPLERYARLRMPDGGERTAGYTEASRGCKHLCRHCPIVPVYGGKFRVVDADAVVGDVRAQHAAGARHVTFGDPDFLNAPAHAGRIVRRVHDEFPDLTYDVTVKVEHLLRHADLLPALRDTGCVLVTSAVESFDDEVLARLDKGHTRADAERAAALLRAAGLPLAPTFVAFMPWTTRRGYLELLDGIDALGWTGAVAPVQLAIRLLIPAGSRLLDLPEIRAVTGAFDPEALAWTWTHPDPVVDRLCEAVRVRVREGQALGESRREIFESVRRLARESAGEADPAGADSPSPAELRPRDADAAVPWLTEPWYC